MDTSRTRTRTRPNPPADPPTNPGAHRLRIAGIGVTIALVAILAVAVWFLFIRDDAPPPVTLDAAVSDSQNITTTPSADTSTSGASSGSVTTTDGSWVLAEGSESFVGYRVGEELAGIGTTEAVGRTAAITANVALSSTVVTTTEISADMTQLASDSSRRDGALRGQSLETGAFPTASFVLTTPIDLGETPVEDTTYKADAIGELTLHGVTRTVTISVEARFTDGFLVIIGTTDIVFADYEIDPPSSQAVLSVEDHGTLEVQLILAQRP